MKTKQVLLIEDDETLGDLIMKKLIEGGFAATWEKNGNDGLRRLKLLRPDLVLLDLVLPGISGEQILSVAQKDADLTSTPIIVISNSGNQPDIDRVLALGAKDYLVKANFHPSGIVDRVNAIFHVTSTSTEKKDPRIMIVEDDQILASLSTKAFERSGYKVVHASDGGECLMLLKKGELPDAILLDIIMPGVNGFDVLRAMKREVAWKKIPVIIFSNYAQEHDLETAHELGAVEFLVKSKMTLKEVIDRVGEILRS